MGKYTATNPVSATTRGSVARKLPFCVLCVLTRRNKRGPLNYTWWWDTLKKFCRRNCVRMERKRCTAVETYLQEGFWILLGKFTEYLWRFEMWFSVSRLTAALNNIQYISYIKTEHKLMSFFKIILLRFLALSLWYWLTCSFVKMSIWIVKYLRVVASDDNVFLKFNQYHLLNGIIFVY